MQSQSQKSELILLTAIIIGVVAGVICGAAFGEAMVSVKFLGTMFMNALKAIVIPLIMASIIVGVASLGDVRKLGPIGGLTIGYYALTTSIAVCLGLIFTQTLQPGTGVTIDEIKAPEGIPESSVMDLIVSIVPSNIFDHMANMEVLPLIVSSLVFGAILTTMGKQAEPVLAVIKGIDEAMIKIVHLVMWFAPIGVFALVASILGEYGGGAAVLDLISNIGMFVVTVLSALAVHAFVMIPLVLWLFTGRNPYQYFLGMLTAVTTAFSTASSAATLPLTMRCVEENNGVSQRNASFVLPIGATINMDGTAIYEAAGPLFIAAVYGIELGAAEIAIIFLTAVLASAGAAAIPSAGLFTMVIVFQAVNLPIEGIGLIYSVDWFLDRFRTAVNVWGDSAGAAVVDHYFPDEPTEPEATA